MKILDKELFICESSKNKKVLHLGCIGFTDLPSNTRYNMLKSTLHYKLSLVANELFGLDYSKEVIEQIKETNDFSEKFSNIYYGNAEKLEDCSLNEKFEIIIIGDLIEHLSNPGLLLNGVKRFCTTETEIIFTTPNAFGIASFLRMVLNKFKEGEEHVMTFNRFNLENLFKRHGYSVQEVNTCYQQHSKALIFFNFFKMLLTFSPKLGGTLLFTVKVRES